MDKNTILPVCGKLTEQFKQMDYFQILLFGASNTERFVPLLYWTDVFECGLRMVCDRKFHLINSGLCGCTTAQALERFDRYVGQFRSQAVIVTLGGNDCRPEPGVFVDNTAFSANLAAIAAEIRKLGAEPIFQTYYQMDLDNMDPERAKNFVRNMELVRQSAADNNVLLVDQMSFFDRIPRDILRYKLLRDPYHLSETGNALMGIILLKHFGIDPLIIEHHEKLLPALEILQKYC